MTDEHERALATFKSERGRLILELLNERTPERLQELATLQTVITAIEADIAHIKKAAPNKTSVGFFNV